MVDVYRKTWGGQEVVRLGEHVSLMTPNDGTLGNYI